MFRASALATASLLVVGTAAAADRVIRLEDLEPARGRVILVEPPDFPASSTDPVLPWGVLQTVQLPVEGPVRGVLATGEALVHISLATRLRVSVKTDPGLLSLARSALVDGMLRLGHRDAGAEATWRVEGPPVDFVRAEEGAVIEVDVWEGESFEIMARGLSTVRIGHLRGGSVRVFVREQARVLVERGCRVQDLWVDTSHEARFDGCGMVQGREAD